MSSNKKPQQNVSRRQFLNYTLTGVGGFMAAGMLMPMVRFAIDPVMKKEASTKMVSVAQVSDITADPKRFDFKVHIKDAWYETDEPKSAWVYKDDSGKIIALSPVCKHLGCTVDWNNKDYPNEFFCPCHLGRYEKDGKNIPGTPPSKPLDRYEQEEKDGTLYLGKARGV